MPRRPEQLSLLPSPAETEVEAYGFIREQLQSLGWSVRNPERHAGGQVWTQNQCLTHPAIRAALGLTRPENIVKISETKLWVIEAKNSRSLLGRALNEAEDDYARRINAGRILTAPLISGVAGNEGTGYEVRTRLLVRGRYQPVTINGVEATGLLDEQTVRTLLESGDPNIADFAVNYSVFQKSAERINRTLHIGGINKNDRARVMAALLLALSDTSGLDVDGELLVLIADINTRTLSVLRRHGKSEFHPFVKIEPPTSSENHVKFKAAIVRTIQELNNLSIKSAMNSGTDVLGKFYEVFLRYGNGAKEIGIVLTPRHVTRFAIETVGVGINDLVFDPACGTGGFLVAAFDHVRERARRSPQIEAFKKYNLFGIEQESYVAALAIVNMIFRGDGKNNIVEANCLSKFLWRASNNGHATATYRRIPPTRGEEPITRVFMNPPFALKKSDEREWAFVEAALKSMADGGMLFAIVPMSVVTEGGTSGGWRRPLLNHHTVLAVLSFPEELFYPVANQTVAVIIRKGAAHPPDQPVLWSRIVNDGFRKSKGRRLPRTDGETDLDRLKPILREFLVDPERPVQVVPEFIRATPLDLADPILELAPEAYLDSHIPGRDELMSRLDVQVRENVGAIVEFDLKTGRRRSIIDQAVGSRQGRRANVVSRLPRMRATPLDEIFSLKAGDFHNLGELDEGDVAMASCADGHNGIAGMYQVPEESIYNDALTIAFNGRPLTTKLHPYRFAAKDDVAVAVPRFALSPEALIFIQAQLNAERWRFSYYRKCFRAKLGRTTVELPYTRGELDVDYMTECVHGQPYWWFLAPRLADWSGPSEA